MVSVSRKLITSRPPILQFPKTLQQHHQAEEDSQPFIPFSQLQQRKLLEWKLVSLLDECCDLSRVKQIHAHVLRKGLDQSCYVLAKLVRVLSKIGVPMDPYPRLVFCQVRTPNPFLWTALIRGYSLQGSFSESALLYNLMRREGTGPVSFTYSALLKACAAAVDVDLGMQVHGQILRLGGFDSDLFVGNTMIDMYVKCGFLDFGRKVFEGMPQRDVISWTALIVAYAKVGRMGAAAELFDGLPVKDMVAWTVMVTGFVQNAQPREALAFFEKMQDAGVETDEVTLVGVISACAQLGATKYANWIREISEKSGHGPSFKVVVGSALIDMYSKCSSVEDAYEVFKKMHERNVYTYSSMISGFAIHGHASEAVKLFEEMVKLDVTPNCVTFISLLTACSHGGFVEQGKHFFAIMEQDYGIKPSADHYTCLVDLLGRAGLLEEALELVKGMPVKPHGGVWGALLGACRIHGNPDVAEFAATHLFELEPDSIGNYVLLANIYSSARRWDDVSRIRKLIRAKGLKKNPASSWVEGKKGMIHEFIAGDTTHPRTDEIKLALEELFDRLKITGYKPNLNSVPYGLSDEKKKRILAGHSEKLALGYGLISTDAGSDIRIVKNVRICEDCHLVMCGASKITGRRIVVRDNTRFHHFCDGACSCGNFW